MLCLHTSMQALNHLTAYPSIAGQHHSHHVPRPCTRAVVVYPILWVGKSNLPPCMCAAPRLCGWPCTTGGAPPAWLCTPPLCPPYVLAIVTPTTCALSCGMASQQRMCAAEVQHTGGLGASAGMLPPAALARPHALAPSGDQCSPWGRRASPRGQRERGEGEEEEEGEREGRGRRRGGGSLQQEPLFAVSWPFLGQFESESSSN